MFTINQPFILASGSPRRKEILDLMGLTYIVDVSDVDETYCAAPDQMVLELSRRKALAVASRHEHSLILAADTLVYGDSVLGKPADEEDAKRMLRALSDSWHSVFTGITLVNTANGKVLSCADETRVHFTKLSEEDICAYVASKEPLDKAGAYGIQGMGGMFIDKIEGSYSNVVGLPMALLRSMLLEMTQE